MGCLDSKPTPLQKNLLTNFVEYYKYIRRKLKAQDFKFKSPVDDISFKDRLAEATGVNKAIVKIWITLYIDYMILAAWSLQTGNKMIIYPPYAIQQVLKLHTTYNKNYLAFNDLITDDRGAISYSPIRLAANLNAQEYNILRDSYYWAKDFLKQNLYHHPAAHKSDTKKLQAEGVWEDFETTVMQCEFNFCFLNSQEKEDFQKILADNPTEVIMANQSPEEIIRVVKTLRGFLKVGGLVDNLQATFAPKIQETNVAEKDQSIFSRLNKLTFSANFVNILALEQRISIDEACKWIAEYKKFLFLIYATEGRVIMSPSEAVDQVWRLHMQFTETYLNDMQMLRPVLYCPPKRNSGENDQSEYLYVETLNVYTKYFGARNEKIWPPGEKRLQDVGRSASYYLFFARGCLTEEQKKKVMLKYTEYTKTKKGRKNSDYTDEYQYYNTSPGLGFDALILGMILMADPFDFNDNYGYDDVNHLGENLEGSQLFDDQSLNNYSLNNINMEGGNIEQFREAEPNNNGGWLGLGGNQNDNGGDKNEDEDGDDDGDGGDGGD